MIDLKFRHKNHFRQFRACIILYLLLEITVGITSLFSDSKLFPIFWALYAIPFFISMIRYQQFTAYVNLIHDRYKIINEIVQTLILNKCEGGELNAGE